MEMILEAGHRLRAEAIVPRITKRLLYIMHFAPSGARTFDHVLALLSQELSERGWEVKLVFSCEPPEEYRRRLFRAGASYVVIAFPFTWASLRQLMRKMKEFRPDLTVTSFLSPFCWPLLALKLLGYTKRLLVCDHSSGGAPLRRGWAGMAVRARGALVGRIVDAVAPVSFANARRDIERVGLPASKVRVIHNGIEVDRFPAPLRRPCSVVRIAFAGQLIREKGVHTLLHALAQLKQQSEIPVELTIAGKGPQEAALRVLSKDLNLSNVTFAGHIDSIPELFAASDIVVVPSEWQEAFGLTIVEAMACRAAVVTSDAGACAEVLGNCGLVFRAGDAGHLAERLRQLIENRNLRLRLGDAAVVRVHSQFQAQDKVQRLSNMCDAVTDGSLASISDEPSGRLRHVVHGVLSLDLGGLERLVLDLVRIGVRRGDRVTVVCVERPGKLARNAERLGAGVVCLNKPPGRSSQAVDDAERLLRELQPDVLHTHQIGALWYLGQAAARVGLRRVVHTEHSDQVRQSRTWLGKLRARYLWWRVGRLAARVCCVSGDVAAAMRRWKTVPASRVAVVANGIDEGVYGDRRGRAEMRQRLGFCNRGAQAVVIGSVGRLSEVKRQDLLVRAVAALAGEFPQLRLLLVGDGPERNRLEGLAAAQGVAELTVFAGYQAHPEQYLAAMDVFALTSRHEALPLSLLEAWASGLPVVSSAVGGIPSLVEQGRTGLLFPSEDLQALVGSLRKILADSELSTRLAEAGRAEVQAKYSLVRMARDYERQYAAAKNHKQDTIACGKPIAFDRKVPAGTLLWSRSR